MTWFDSKDGFQFKIMDTLLITKHLEHLGMLSDTQDSLIDSLERLLACYRFGKRPAGKLLDDIHDLKESIKILKKQLYG